MRGKRGIGTGPEAGGINRGGLDHILTPVLGLQGLKGLLRLVSDLAEAYPSSHTKQAVVQHGVRKQKSFLPPSLFLTCTGYGIGHSTQLC